MKPYLKILGITTVALIALSFKKYSDYSAVINKITFFMSKIRNVKRRNGKGYFDFDLVLHNPTDIDFSFDTAGYITVKQIDVLHDGRLLGTAYSNATRIQLPPKSSFRITDIQIEVVLLGVLGQLAAIVQDQSKLTAQITIDALGTTYIMEQPFVF